MSDPLSVAAGVVGIVTAAVQVSKLLIDFTNGTTGAPRQATAVLEKVNSIHTTMSQLQPFVLGLQTPDQSRSCLIQVEAVIAILTGCVATFSELEQLLDNLKAEGLAFLDKMKWAKKQSTIDSLITRLETHETSLSLMLNILNGNTMQEVKVSVNRLDATMNERYHEILTRLRSLESRQAGTSRPVSRSSTVLSRHSLLGEWSQREGRNNQENEPQTMKIFNLKFEKDLAITRVYRNIRFPGSTSSLVTTEDEPKSRWSMLSDPSVADIASQISVLNLAISASEVYNLDRYTTKNLDHFLGGMTNRGQTDELPEEELAQAMGKLLQLLPRFTNVHENTARESLTAEAVITAAFEDLGLPSALYPVYMLYMIHDSPQKEANYMIDSRYKYFWKRLDNTEKPLRIWKNWVRKGRHAMLMIRRAAGPFVGAQGITKCSIEELGYLIDGWLVDAEAFLLHTKSCPPDSLSKDHAEEFYIPAVRYGMSMTSQDPALRYIRATLQESCRVVLRRTLEEYNIPSRDWGRYRLAILDNAEVQYLGVLEKPLALFNEGRSPHLRLQEVWNEMPAYPNPEIDPISWRSKSRIWPPRPRKVPYVVH